MTTVNFEHTRKLIDILESNPEIGELFNLTSGRVEETGTEYVVLWTKKNATREEHREILI